MPPHAVELTAEVAGIKPGLPQFIEQRLRIEVTRQIVRQQIGKRLLTVVTHAAERLDKPGVLTEAV